MIKWLNERIMFLARRLEHNQFIGSRERVLLEEELSKLLGMRENYYEQGQEEEQEEVDRSK